MAIALLDQEPNNDRDVHALVSLVARAYRPFDTSALIHVTHDHQPWVDARGGRPDDEPMPIGAIEQCFLKQIGAYPTAAGVGRQLELMSA